jgi:hypothetical protein
MNAKKPRAPRAERQGVVWFCGRILGLLWSGWWCAFGTIFAHQIVGRWGFRREKWGWLFYFLAVGGCANVVPFAHQGVLG